MTGTGCPTGAYGATVAAPDRVYLYARAWHLIACAYARACGVPRSTASRWARALHVGP